MTTDTVPKQYAVKFMLGAVSYTHLDVYKRQLPIMFSLEALTEDMLVKILKEPKNAIIKQYQKLLEMDEVRLNCPPRSVLCGWPNNSPAT